MIEHIGFFCFLEIEWSWAIHLLITVHAFDHSFWANIQFFEKVFAVGFVYQDRGKLIIRYFSSVLLRGGKHNIQVKNSEMDMNERWEIADLKPWLIWK